jgi:hypothetical protein
VEEALELDRAFHCYSFDGTLCNDLDLVDSWIRPFDQTLVVSSSKLVWLSIP